MKDFRCITGLHHFVPGPPMTEHRPLLRRGDPDLHPVLQTLPAMERAAGCRGLGRPGAVTDLPPVSPETRAPATGPS